MSAQPCQRLFFQDGDVQLRVQMSKECGSRIYDLKLHKAFLAVHSAPLVNIIARHGGDPDAPLTIAGDGEYFIELMEAIYRPSYLVKAFKETPDSCAAQSFHGLLTQAMKYQVHEVVKVVLEHVMSLWPATLQEYDQLLHMQDAKRRFASRTAQALLDNPTDVFWAVRYAIDFRVARMLPMAFFVLASRDFGYGDKDPLPIAIDAPPGPNTRWDLLDWNVRRTLMQATEDFRKEALGLSGWYCDGGTDYCNRKRKSILFKLQTLPGGSRDLLKLTRDFAQIVKASEFDEAAKENVCRLCKGSVVATMEKTRADIWQLLPKHSSRLLCGSDGSIPAQRM